MRPESESRETVLSLLALGYTRGQIAVELDLSPNTVRRIIRRECRRRDMCTEALRRALRADLDDEAIRA